MGCEPTLWSWVAGSLPVWLCVPFAVAALVIAALDRYRPHVHRDAHVHPRS